MENQENQITEIRYYAEGNEEIPFMSIVPLEGEVKESETQPDTSELKNWLNAIGSQLPTAMVNVANLTQQIVTFSPEVAKGLQTGLYSALNKQGFLTGVARNQAGKKIVEHGNIVTKVNPIAVAGLVWQVMAIVTAQKFLSDIDKKLYRIGDTVQQVKEFLENEQISKITGTIEYLNKVAKVLQQNGFTDIEIASYYTNLEAKEAQILQIKNHVKNDIENEINKLIKKDFKVSGGTIFDGHLERHFENVTGSIKIIENKMYLYHTLLSIRIFNAQVQSGMPINQVNAKIILESSMNDLSEFKDLINTFFQNVKNKVPEFKATHSSKETDAEYQGKILGKVVNFKTTILKKCSELNLHTQDINAKHNNIKNPRYLVSYDENKQIKDIKLIV